MKILVYCSEAQLTSTLHNITKNKIIELKHEVNIVGIQTERDVILFKQQTQDRNPCMLAQ